MATFVATGAGFLVAVLWFDLMFDVQTRRYRSDPLPETVLMSIAAYYRRVTTDAAPMNRLVALVMAATTLAIVVEVARGPAPLWISGSSLVLASSAIGLAAARTVRNAVRLGGASDSQDERTRLARTIYHDHVYCLTAMAAVLVLQLTAAL